MALLSLLAGCQTLPPEVRVIREAIPVELTFDCVVPVVIAKTNADLVKVIMDLDYALDLCNIDKAALRVWSKGAP